MENPHRPKQPNIKIFRAIQANLSTVGIDQDTAIHSYPYAFNVKILLNLFAFNTGIILTSMYIIIEAKTFLELAQAICVFSVFIFAILVLMTVICNLSEFYKSIDDCECLVNTSE